MNAEHDAHAAHARSACRAAGLADCIHFATNATSRADALYAAANASGLPWYLDRSAGPGLLADGRMVLTSNVVCFFEVAR